MPTENKPAPKDDRKLNFTPDELDEFARGESERAIAAEREKWQKEADEAAAKKKAEDEEAKAKEQGEYQTLAEKEKQKREKAEGELATLRRDLALRDLLAAEQPDYLASAVDIAPHIPADTKADELPKAIKKAVTEFVARNPRQPKGSAGAPPAPRGGSRVAAGRIPNQRPSTAGVASSRF